eukprot:1154773-Pelagomonas_calceolata.AAC.7
MALSVRGFQACTHPCPEVDTYSMKPEVEGYPATSLHEGEIQEPDAAGKGSQQRGGSCQNTWIWRTAACRNQM